MQLSIFKSRDETGNAINQAPGSLVNTHREREREREVGHIPHHFQHLLADNQQQEQLLQHFATSACRQQWAPHLPVFGAALDALGRHAPVPHPEELRRHRIREEMGEPNSTEYPVTM